MMVEKTTVLRDDPLLQDALAVRELSGLSGAEVFLVTRDERHWFVRKAAKQVEASARLRRQARKQAAFAHTMDGLVRTPQILDEGEIDGRFYVDMEFVRGIDGAGYLRRASFAEISAFADRLCQYLEVAAEKETLAASTHTNIFEALFAKICEVQRKSVAISTETLSKLLLALDRLRVLGDVRSTLCHGDLTLENIIVGPDETIWMLDLLDSPFEHYWQDIAKIHQDLAGNWYLRREAPIARYALDYVSRRILQTATGLHDVYADIHALLLACTFARILPYTTTSEERDLVTERLDHFVQRITV